MSFCFEEVMTVDLKIRGPFPARDDLLIIQIVEGALTGAGVYKDRFIRHSFSSIWRCPGNWTKQYFQTKCSAAR